MNNLLNFFAMKRHMQVDSHLMNPLSVAVASQAEHHVEIKS